MEIIASSAINSTRPLVGISGCLTGQKVRYDGNSKLSSFYDSLSFHLSWLNFCPEVEAGLGIPRPPVQLIETEQGTQALGVKDRSFNVTKELLMASQSFWQHHFTQYPASTKQPQNFMCGYIFKSRSPSCGLGSTPLYRDDDPENSKKVFTSGIFASEALRHPYPLVFAEETSLTSPENQAIFISACYVNQALHSNITLDCSLLDLLMGVTGIEKNTLEKTPLLDRLFKTLSDSDSFLSSLENQDLTIGQYEKTALDRRFFYGQLVSFWGL